MLGNNQSLELCLTKLFVLNAMAKIVKVAILVFVQKTGLQKKDVWLAKELVKGHVLPVMEREKYMYQINRKI